MDTALLAYLILIASLLLLDFPLFVIRDVERMTAKELVEAYPQFSAVVHRNRIITAIIYILLLTITILILLNETRFTARYFLLFVPFVGGISLYNGITAYSRGIFVNWMSRYGDRYYYDKDRIKHGVAEIQIGLAFVFIAASLFLYFA